MPTFNPYTAGNPIGEATAFFGREDVLKQVRNTLRNPREPALVLFGQRRIGKTSVLLQLERELARTKTATAVYFDLQDKATKPLADVLYELAQRIAAKTGVGAPDRGDFDADGAFFRETFLPGVTARLGQTELVLLFDEFDVLDSPSERRAGQTFFPYLRAWMDSARQVRFVFVIGRRPEDLSIETLSAFKGVRSARVSLLRPEATRAVVRQSAGDGGLEWTDAAVDEVIEWTRGHAYLTQLLCSAVWESAVDTEPAEARPVEPSLVNAAIDDALQQGANAFQWIWDGLPPAERVVIAAMAEAVSPVITHEALTEILSRSGVRLIVRELELAPDTLVEWELLRPEGEGYTFAVPLFRRWVSKHRPLRRVKDELDRLDPLAETLFQTGQQFYRLGQRDDADQQLRRALRINPNHLKSRLLLGRLLLEMERASDSVTVLEEAYAYDQPAARADLIRALLAAADAQEEDRQIAIYSRVVEIDPAQAHGRERLEQIRTARRLRELAITLQSGGEHELAEHWSTAIELYRKLLEEFPDQDDIRARLVQAQSKSALAQCYAEAIAAVESGDLATAQTLLARVITEAPGHKEAARYLLRATIGVDVVLLADELEAARHANEELTRQVNALRRHLEFLLPRQATELPPPEPASRSAAADGRVKPRVKASEEEQRRARHGIIKTLALAKSGEAVVCPVCQVKMTREQLLTHADSH